MAAKTRYGAIPTYPSYPRSRSGLVGPINPLVGAEEPNKALDWAKENKWYLIGGGLVAAAGVAYFVTRNHY